MFKKFKKPSRKELSLSSLHKKQNEKGQKERK